MTNTTIQSDWLSFSLSHIAHFTDSLSPSPSPSSLSNATLYTLTATAPDTTPDTTPPGRPWALAIIHRGVGRSGILSAAGGLLAAGKSRVVLGVAECDATYPHKGALLPYGDVISAGISKFQGMIIIGEKFGSIFRMGPEKDPWIVNDNDEVWIEFIGNLQTQKIGKPLTVAERERFLRASAKACPLYVEKTLWDFQENSCEPEDGRLG